MIKYFFYSIGGVILLVWMLIFLVGSLWVLRIALDECMTTWRVNMTDWWKDVPEDVKRAVKSIENRQRYIRKLRDEGKMSPEKHIEEIEKLEKRLDDVERLSRV